MPGPVTNVLSRSQIDMLAEHGEERTAAAGEVLFEVGDETYPFIAIREGEASIQDSNGREIVRLGASEFIGEMNLLSGQTVFLTAVVTEPMRYVAVDRFTLRDILFEDGALSDMLLSAFVRRRESLQKEQGIGIEIVGPTQDHASRDLVEYAKRQRLPYSWRDPGTDAAAA
jgi:thioredoxin reductase (NADPH)